MTADTLRALAQRVRLGDDDPDLSTEIYDALAFTREAVLRAKCGEAVRGSIDACLALHEATLGDRWVLDLSSDPGEWDVDLTRKDPDGTAQDAVAAFASTFARAYLAAILRAIATEKEATP